MGCTFEEFQQTAVGRKAELITADSQIHLKTYYSPAFSVDVGRCEAAIIYYHFIQQDYKYKLAQINVEFESDDFQQIQAGFHEKYGVPEQSSTDAVQNGLGMKFENKVESWSNGINHIKLSRFSKRADRCAVVYSDGELIAVWNKRERSLHRSVADDI